MAPCTQGRYSSSSSLYCRDLTRRARLLVASASKRQSRRRREESTSESTVVDSPVEQLPFDPRSLYDVPLPIEDGELILPQAPAPKYRKDGRPVSGGPDANAPGSYYPVFTPEPGSIKQIRDGPWRWDDDEEEEPEEPESSRVPPVRWHPRTGFTVQDVAAPGQTSGTSSSSSSAAGAPGSTERPDNSAAARYEPRVNLTVPAVATSGEDLAPVGKGQVLTSSLGAGFSMAILAVFLRAYAGGQAVAVLGTDPEAVAKLLVIPPGLSGWQDAAVMVGAATTVVVARWQLCGVWGELREATDRANKQVLTPLNWFDIALVAALSGVPEELLFRGAIIPASFPDWRGVLISGAIFGGLHVTGGRNAAFAAWAAAVGCLYGTAYLVTGNIWAAAGAHTLANFVSAVSWKSRQGGEAKPADKVGQGEAKPADKAT